MAMFCSECGAALEPDDQFCRACGAAAGDLTAATGAAPASAESSGGTLSKDRSALVVWSGILVGLLLVLAAVAFWYSRSYRFRPREEPPVVRKLPVNAPHAGENRPVASPESRAGGSEAPRLTAPPEVKARPAAEREKPLPIEAPPSAEPPPPRPPPPSRPAPASPPATAAAPQQTGPEKDEPSQANRTENPLPEIVVDEAAEAQPPRPRGRVFLPGTEAYSPPPPPPEASAPEAARALQSAPSVGRLYWSGRLKKNQIIVYQAGRVDAGSIGGDNLTGKPVEVRSFSPAIEIVEAPSAANGWTKLSFRCLRSTKQSATINFEWRAAE